MYKRYLSLSEIFVRNSNMYKSYMFLLDSDVIYGACMNHTCFCKIEIEPLTHRNNLAKTSLPYIFHQHAFVKFSLVNIFELANFLCFYPKW